MGSFVQPSVRSPIRPYLFAIVRLHQSVRPPVRPYVRLSVHRPSVPICPPSAMSVRLSVLPSVRLLFVIHQLATVLQTPCTLCSSHSRYLCVFVRTKAYINASINYSAINYISVDKRQMHRFAKTGDVLSFATPIFYRYLLVDVVQHLPTVLS